MSNINKFLKGGKGKKEAPVEAVAPKPIKAAPLVEAKTRQVDLSALAQSDAAQASEDEVTVEVAGKAPPLYPSAPPKPVPPAAASGKVVSISSARAAPVEAEAEAGEAGEESPAPSVPAKSAAEKTFDAAKLLEQIKTTVQGLLVPVREEIAKLVERVAVVEDSVKGNDESVNAVIETIAGPNPEDPDAKQVDDEGKPIEGLTGQVAALKGALEEIKTRLTYEGQDVIQLLVEACPVVVAKRARDERHDFRVA